MVRTNLEVKVEGAGKGLFSFDRVWLERDGVTILRGVDALVPPIGITALVGPSGAGKTTLLRMCNRLEVPTSGRVHFRGNDVADLDPLQLRRRVGMVFQQAALFGGTVRDNLAVALPAAHEDRYAAALEAAALDRELLDRTSDSLSGGEMQRVCLARTLVTEPEVLLLDEPTTGLNAAPKVAFEQLAVRLADVGMPTLWVTHDLHQVERVADQVVGLIGGTVVYQGDTDGLRHEASLTRLLAEGGGT